MSHFKMVRKMVCYFAKNKDPAQVLSCGFCEIFKNIIFYSTPQVNHKTYSKIKIMKSFITETYLIGGTQVNIVARLDQGY